MSQSGIQLLELIEDWKFSVDDEGGAWGEICGVPTALTPLGYDPPAVMFAFRVHDDAKLTPELESLVVGLPSIATGLSVENGYAWLSLYDLTALPDGTLRELPESIADQLTTGNLAVPPGCLKCATFSGAVPLMIENRPTRLCPACLAEAVDEHQAAEEAVNRPTLSSTLGLPGAFVYVLLGWTLYWSSIDFVMDWMGIRGIRLVRPVLWGGCLLCAATGYALGWPLGATLRRSIGLRRIPWVASFLITAVAALLGEIGSIAVWIFRWAGFVNLRAAAQLLGLFVRDYSSFWIFCKLAQAVVIAVFAAIAARQRKTVPIRV